MRIYEFEQEHGVFVGVKVDCENKTLVTVKNVGAQIRSSFESTHVGDIADCQQPRVTLVRLIHFLKQVFDTEKKYGCGTDEKIKKSIAEDYPLLYDYMSDVKI